MSLSGSAVLPVPYPWRVHPGIPPMFALHTSLQMLPSPEATLCYLSVPGGTSDEVRRKGEGRGDMRELGQNNAEKRGKRWRGLKRKREQNGDERGTQIREERG